MIRPVYATAARQVFVIAAHFEQAELLLWSDASLTLTKPARVTELAAMARARGLVQVWG